MKTRWLVTTLDPGDPSSGWLYPLAETTEIDEHPAEYLNGLPDRVALVLALRLHPEDPELGK